MSTLFPAHKLVIATHNAGKVKEFADLINHDGLQLLNAGELNLLEPEETGITFAENAILKSKAAFAASGIPSLADDSGLSVGGLDGQPGIYSARWAIQKNFAPAFEKIHDTLTAKNINPEGAKAAFICVLALTLNHQQTLVAEGKIMGHLTFPPRGENGFGYDPIFIPDGDTRTFSQMSATEKHDFSHRARAIEQLKKIVNFA